MATIRRRAESGNIKSQRQLTWGGVRLIGYLAMWARDRLLMTHNTEKMMTLLWIPESANRSTFRFDEKMTSPPLYFRLLSFVVIGVEEESENVRITEKEALPRKWNSQVNCRSSSSRKSSLGCADRLCASAAFTYARVYQEIKALSLSLSRMISREEKVGAEDPSAFRPVVSHAVGLARALATAPS